MTRLIMMLLAAALLVPVSAAAQDDATPPRRQATVQETLAIAYIAGACNTLMGTVKMQEARKLEGGVLIFSSMGVF